MSTILQGDVQRLYDQMRRRWPSPPAGPIPALDQVRAIWTYYAAMEPEERRLLLAWARKEESGIGMIPSTLSALPLIGLLFVPLIQQVVGRFSAVTWLTLWGIGGLVFAAGVYVHQRQRAYTTLHIEILEQLCRGGEPRS